MTLIQLSIEEFQDKYRYIKHVKNLPMSKEEKRNSNLFENVIKKDNKKILFFESLDKCNWFINFGIAKKLNYLSEKMIKRIVRS